MNGSSAVGLKKVGVALAAILLLFVVVALIGERYGNRSPAPERRRGPLPVCGRYDHCTER
ncbi:MAG TPA: hypothetical protein VGL86_24705 [Polyangia bacterium]|jgi:hypothetical protein